MVEENISQEIRLKNIYETRSFLEEKSKMNWWIKTKKGL